MAGKGVVTKWERVRKNNHWFDALYAEDLANLVFDGVRPGGLLLEGVQVREQFLIDEGEQVVAAQGGVVVNLPVFALRRCPTFPPVWLVEDVRESKTSTPKGNCVLTPRPAPTRESESFARNRASLFRQQPSNFRWMPLHQFGAQFRNRRIHEQR